MYTTYKNLTNIYKDPNYLELVDQLLNGSKVSIIGEERDYYFIKTNYNYRGFVKKRDLIKKELSRSNIKDIALRFIDTPYLWGGKSFDGIDCSGFVSLVYSLCGRYIYRDSNINERIIHDFHLTIIDENDLDIGDLIYTFGHVMMFIGNGEVIHASKSKEKVLIEKLKDLDFKVIYYINVI